MIAAFVNVDIFTFLEVGCIMGNSYYKTLVFTTLMPIAVAVSIFVIAYLNTRMGPDDSKKAIWDTAIAVFLGWTFVIFSTVSTCIFQTFLCKQYGDDPIRYLVMDPTINCDSPEHAWWKRYALIMVGLYPCK